MKQTELISPSSKANSKIKIWPDWLNFSLLDGLLLAAALIAAWLPVGWTRDLKRIKQAPLYAWLSFGYFLVYALAIWWALRPASKDENYRQKWLALTLLVALPNFFNIWLRTNSLLPDGSLLFGQDADMTLFLKYGQDFAQSRYPLNFKGEYMEYPQFALFLFWFGAILSGGKQLDFNWIFPLILTFFQLIAAFSLYGVGRKLGRVRTGFLAAAFVAGCPALFSFNYTRYDAAPAAILVLAIYFYLPKSSERGARASGAFVAAGGLLKWLPAIVAPWLILGYAQARRWRHLAIFAAAGLLVTLLTSLPFYLWNSDAFWYPYKFQGSRKLIGESFWFLIQRDFLDPARTTPEKPWGEPAKVILGNNKLLAAQLGLTLLVLILSVWRLWWVRRKLKVEDWGGWAAAGLVAVAVFTLANRVFSPQYMVLLAWVWAAALLLRPTRYVGLVFAFALISISTAANFRVYLLGVYPEEWLRDSWIMFGAGWLLCGWLLRKSFVTTQPA